MAWPKQMAQGKVLRKKSPSGEKENVDEGGKEGSRKEEAEVGSERVDIERERSTAILRRIKKENK